MKSPERGAMVVEGLMQVPLGRLMLTEHNPRKLDPKDPSLIELAKSIDAHGQLQPGVARPSGRGEGHYELLAGCRRWWACNLAGKDSMLVIVRDLDDKAAREVTVLENLQRSDLTPLEEAAGIRMLVQSGASSQEIADKIGKPWSWVVKRDRLNDLSAAWRNEMENPESRYCHFTAGHLELIARYAPALQDKLLEDLRSSLYSLPRSVEQLDQALAEYSALLHKAIWDLDDATLIPKAGACSTCPKRSGCNPGLFGEAETLDPKADRCLDVTCYNRKNKAFLVRKEAELRQEHPDLLLIQKGWQEKGLKGSLNEYDVDRAKKTDKQARPALITAGPGKGSLVYVKIKAHAQPTAAHDPKQAEKIAREEEKAKKAMAQREALAECLMKTDRPKAFTAAFAIHSLLYLCGDEGLLDAERLKELQEKTAEDGLEQAWEYFQQRVSDELNQEWSSPGKADVKWVADFIGADLKTLAAAKPSASDDVKA